MQTRNKGVRKGTGFKTYAVVVDGQTEMWYLQMLKRNEPNCTITVKPELPKKKTLDDQCRLVSRQFDIVVYLLYLYHPKRI
ncbi:hypothetical protein [Mucilaginibacter paludis]|uniref:hypothetical protein n=1 Tax=Mucilaginibacter paludis TaxID=423351 RepID=UPI0002555CBA|nr:hypothetical protein [Mucilaginibacter paludis]